MAARRAKQEQQLKNFNLVEIKPLTEGQKDLIEAYKEGYNLVLHGFAGTGKTYLSLALALSDIIKSKYKKLIILRSAVGSRDIGFLPGTLKEKIEVYEIPYINIVNELLQRGDGYDILKQKEVIEFSTTSFLRGTTFNDCIVIVDEVQNMIFQEIDTVITRIGENCKIIFCGDITQNDLTQNREKTGVKEFLRIIETLDEFEIIDFTAEDIVRSSLVKNYIIRKQKLIDNGDIVI